MPYTGSDLRHRRHHLLVRLRCVGTILARFGIYEVDNGSADPALLLVHIVWLMVLGFSVLFGFCRIGFCRFATLSALIVFAFSFTPTVTSSVIRLPSDAADVDSEAAPAFSAESTPTFVELPVADDIFTHAASILCHYVSINFYVFSE